MGEGVEAPEFFVVPSTFWHFKYTVSRFGERIRYGQYMYSLVSFLFAVLLFTVPPCPAICKSGGYVPPFSMGSAPLATF